MKFKISILFILFCLSIEHSSTPIDLHQLLLSSSSYSSRIVTDLLSSSQPFLLPSLFPFVQTEYLDCLQTAKSTKDSFYQCIDLLYTRFNLVVSHYKDLRLAFILLDLIDYTYKECTLVFIKELLDPDQCVANNKASLIAVINLGEKTIFPKLSQNLRNFANNCLYTRRVFHDDFFGSSCLIASADLTIAVLKKEYIDDAEYLSDVIEDNYSLCLSINKKSRDYVNSCYLKKVDMLNSLINLTNNENSSFSVELAENDSKECRRTLNDVETCDEVYRKRVESIEKNRSKSFLLVKKINIKEEKPISAYDKCVADCLTYAGVKGMFSKCRAECEQKKVFLNSEGTSELYVFKKFRKSGKSSAFAVQRVCQSVLLYKTYYFL